MVIKQKKKILFILIFVITNIVIMSTIYNAILYI